MKDFENFVELLDSIEWDENEIRKSFEKSNSKKGIKILDDVNEKYLEVKEKTELLKVSIEENLKSDDLNNAQIRIAIAAASALATSYGYIIRVIELVNFVRTKEVLSVLSDIDIKKTAEELNAIDVRLTEFIEHNHLETLYEADKYPEHLIDKCRERLNRISLNYGREKVMLNDENNFTDFEEIIDFPRGIFLKQSNFELFKYLVDNYAQDKRPVDLSHIFRWMEEKKLIGKRVGKKYMNYCRDNDLVEGKFTRMSDPDRNTRTPLNELQKAFNQMGVKTSK